MDQAEKTTIDVTLAVHEEILTSLLAQALANAPQEQVDAMKGRIEQGAVLNPIAPLAPDLDTADKIAGFGLEYHDVISHIFAQALAMSGR